MAKQRATQHNGRKSSKGAFSSKHNDRNYGYEEAPNLDPNMTDTNFYWNRYDGGYYHKDREGKLTFEEAEKRFYSEHFTEQWQRTNERYIKNGHKERCKTFADWCKMDCNLPEESYIQIGDKENPASKQDFLKVMNLYNKRLNEWNKQHGYPFSTIDRAFHFDEAVPQQHTRRLWKYQDKDGVWCIGQEKALEQAGVPLPDPSKPKSRFNNRKMTFDKMAREMYLQCCLECGLEVETEPLKGVRHNMSKDEALEVKLAQKQKALEAREEAVTVKEQQLDSREQKLDKREAEFNQEVVQMLEKAEATPNAWLEEFWGAFPTAKGYYDKFRTEKTNDVLRKNKIKLPTLDESLAPTKPKTKGIDNDIGF